MSVFYIGIFTTLVSVDFKKNRGKESSHIRIGHSTSLFSNVTDFMSELACSFYYKCKCMSISHFYFLEVAHKLFGTNFFGKAFMIISELKTKWLHTSLIDN